ncbi:MAG: hypothetical protein [Podoviridae sp. ctLUJ1]|nr:MAG: hypothetical protein [Podoviridae sp. ctLUJ1]
MALPISPNTITAAMINVELGRAANAPFNINGAEERALAGKPSGTISFSDFHGKSSFSNKLGFEYPSIESGSSASSTTATYSASIEFSGALPTLTEYEGVKRPGSIIVATRGWHPSIVSFLTPVITDLNKVVDLSLYEFKWAVTGGSTAYWNHPSNPPENTWVPLQMLRFGCKFRGSITTFRVSMRRKSDFSDTASIDWAVTGE